MSSRRKVAESLDHRQEGDDEWAMLSFPTGIIRLCRLSLSSCLGARPSKNQPRQTKGRQDWSIVYQTH